MSSSGSGDEVLMILTEETDFYLTEEEDKEAQVQAYKPSDRTQ